MTPRLASLSDAVTIETHSRSGDKAGVAEHDEKIKLGIPGKFIIGDLILARANPSTQGVVLGKTKGREAIRVLLAPYASASVPIASVIIDIPAAIIPPQTSTIFYTFWNPIAVQNYVLYLAKKGSIKREQESLLVAWVNTKQYPEDSVYSATSELSVAEVASPGLVRARIKECESLAISSSADFPAVTDVEVVVPTDLSTGVGKIREGQMRQTSAVMQTRSSEVREKSQEKQSRSASTNEPSDRSASSSSSIMAPPTTVESALQVQLQQFSADTKQQLKELTELVGGLARRQKAVEDKLNEATSSNTAQWEELDLRLNAITQRPEESTDMSRPRERQATQVIDEGGPEWLVRSQRRDDSDWQVNSRPGVRALNEVADEVIECPFPTQSRRNDSYRVQRMHRRAHRRLLEDVYGSNDSAVAAAHQLLGQMERDTRAPTWEAAVLLQIAKGLDIILLEHCDGMWSQWNQPIVDFLARFYFEMVARVRPEEDVVQLMQPDLQKKLREFNFGKQRMYGPVATFNRQQKNWRTPNLSDSSKPYQRDSGSFQKKGQWSGMDKGGEGNSGQNDATTGQGAWMWHPGVTTGKNQASFRPEPPPFPPGSPAVLPSQ